MANSQNTTTSHRSQRIRLFPRSWGWTISWWCSTVVGMMVVCVWSIALNAPTSSRAFSTTTATPSSYYSTTSRSSMSMTTRSRTSLPKTTTTTSQAAVQLQSVEFSLSARNNGAGGSTSNTNNNNDNAPAPVLLLHGLLGSKRNFATIGTALSTQLDTPRTIIGLDLRNHGDNGHDWRDTMGYDEMAQDVLTYMDTQCIDRAVLVGHSMGGKVAQAVALLQPHRVDGLVVLDIAPVKYHCDEPHWKAVHDIVTVLTTIPIGPSSTKQHVDQQLRSAIPDPALRAFCLSNWDARTGTWKIHLQAIASQLDALADFQMDPSSTYHGDAFFIHGGQSRFVRHAYMETIASYFPNHLLTTVRGVGHWIHAEAPGDTIALLKRYLDR